jgi:hypothetical protein
LNSRIVHSQVIPFWVNFVGSCIRRCWYILWLFGIFCCQLMNLMAICYILCSFDTYFPFWYIVPRQIWQPCLWMLAYKCTYQQKRSPLIAMYSFGKICFLMLLTHVMFLLLLTHEMFLLLLTHVMFLMLHVMFAHAL